MDKKKIEFWKQYIKENENIISTIVNQQFFKDNYIINKVIAYIKNKLTENNFSLLRQYSPELNVSIEEYFHKTISRLSLMGFWHNFVEDNYEKIKEIVQKRFIGNKEDFKEALSFVNEKMIEKDMRNLTLYDPKRGAKPMTYFICVVNSQILRFIKTKYPKKKPPKKIYKNNDFLYFYVFQLLVVEKRDKDEIFEIIKNSPYHRRPKNEVLQAIELVQKECFTKPKTKVVDIDTDTISDNNNTYFDDELKTEALIKIIIGEQVEPKVVNNDKMLLMLKEKLKLTPETQLIIKMVYVDCMDRKLVANKFNISINAVNKRINNSIKKINKLIKNNKRSFLDLYDDSRFSFKYWFSNKIN